MPCATRSTRPKTRGLAQTGQEAKGIVGEYQSYLASEPMVGALDNNPFTKIDGVARVQATLQAIVAYL